MALLQTNRELRWTTDHAWVPLAVPVPLKQISKAGQYVRSLQGDPTLPCLIDHTSHAYKASLPTPMAVKRLRTIACRSYAMLAVTGRESEFVHRDRRSRPRHHCRARHHERNAARLSSPAVEERVHGRLPGTLGSLEVHRRISSSSREFGECQFVSIKVYQLWVLTMTLTQCARTVGRRLE